MVENKIKVLIADDNPDFTEILRDYLSFCEEIEVVAIAKNGLEAIEHITSKEPDVALLDVFMPYLDGLGVLERMKSLSIGKKPLFIMISAAGQEMLTQKALSLSAALYVVKPFDIENLISKIKKLCLSGSNTHMLLT